MHLTTIDGEEDLRIHNISILPSDQCATEDQRAAKCCCGDGFFFDFPRKRCEISLNVGFMFGRLNNGWSHMIVYGFAYPMLLLTMIAPLCAVMLGMGKREKREGDRRFPNPLYQMIWLLSFCGWVSVLAPLPFTVWYYIIGEGTRSLNQSVVMCHVFRTTMEAIPHTVDTMMTLFSVLLAAARFLTQYHRNTLKLRTVERFSRAIWLIIFICIAIGLLRHGANASLGVSVYGSRWCVDEHRDEIVLEVTKRITTTKKGAHGNLGENADIHIKSVEVADLIRERNSDRLQHKQKVLPFEVFLPLSDFVVQFLIPGCLLALLHVGFIREPEIDMGDMTRQPLPPPINVRFEDDDEDVGDSRNSISDTEGPHELLLRQQRERRGTRQVWSSIRRLSRTYLSVSHSFDTGSLRSFSRKGSAIPDDVL
ncbi:hypothetical protein ANCCEY_03925 [Ancylostoma ceylanicum]|uniref:G-protein coupled receptors family 1 profile domain-containing protein n=1 Tax=Ancylostoma ceylanicum TaxID=53326 RepID=A0A0D6MAJ1_9BILA|nr:hypothetical protein ANCCEY_03925 [Ancylostoma ceylanicum]